MLEIKASDNKINEEMHKKGGATTCYLCKIRINGSIIANKNNVENDIK
jgi:hypothetical protein